MKTDDQPLHRFDQTNGLVPPEDAEGDRPSRDELDRRRRESSAHAYAAWAAGNQ